MGEARGPESAAPVAESVGALAQPPAGGPAPALGALAGGIGNHAFSRTVARDDSPPGGGGGASTAAPPSTSSAIPDDPAATILKLGDRALEERIAPKKPITKELKSKSDWSTPAALGRLEFNIVPGFFAHFGVSASVAAAYGASISLSLDRSEEGAQKYVDAVTVKGAANANALLNGSLSAGLGVGFKGLNVTAHASGSLRLDARGSVNISGTARRTGGAGNWTNWGGAINIDGELTGQMVAAASGYFQWQVLWWDGKFGEFRIAEWKLGEASIKVKGTASLDGKSNITLTPKFSPPQRPNVQKSGQISPPAGKAPAGAQIAPKRKAAPSAPADGAPRPGLAAFAAMVAREGTGDLPPQAPPATAPQTPADPSAAAPADPTQVQPADVPVPPPATPVDAGMPGGTEGFVTVPTGPTEGE